MQPTKPNNENHNYNEFGRISPRVRAKMINDLQQAGINNQTVINAMGVIKRHLFVDEALQHKSYDNSPLPIGNKQTISQPLIVAIMSQALLGENTKLNKVLEIGTGSGYQAAILSQLANTVYTVERIQQLIPKAKLALKQCHINNVHIKYADGYYGWQDQQPFDGIIVTAAAKGVPKALVDQLKIGGKIIIPVNNDTNQQNLLEVTKTIANYDYELITKVKFVPMLTGVV